MNNNFHEEYTKRTCILVFGMPYSGAGVVAQLFKCHGFTVSHNLSNKMCNNNNLTSKSNPLADLLDQLLIELRINWHDWRPINFNAIPVVRLEHIKREITGAIEKQFQNAPAIVMHDPRMCRFPALFAECAQLAGYDVKIVCVIRHPLEVIASVMAEQKRLPAHYSRANAALMWLAYYLDATACLTDRSHSIISYERLIADWRTAAGTIQTHCGLTFPLVSDQTSLQSDKLLKAELRHHRLNARDGDADRDVRGWVRTTWDALNLLLDNPHSKLAKNKLAHMRTKFARSACRLDPRSPQRGKEELLSAAPLAPCAAADCDHTDQQNESAPAIADMALLYMQARAHQEHFDVGLYQPESKPAIAAPNITKLLRR